MSDLEYLKKFPVTTERLVLKRSETSIAQECYNAVAENRQHLAGTMRWDPMEATLESITSFLQKLETESNQGRQFGLSMFDKHTKKYVGQLDVIAFDRECNLAEIGYWIRGSEAGKGYTTEGLKALCKFLRDEMNVKTIRATTLPENKRSQNVLIKAGFKKTGKHVVSNLGGACKDRECLEFELQF